MQAIPGILDPISISLLEIPPPGLTFQGYFVKQGFMKSSCTHRHVCTVNTIYFYLVQNYDKGGIIHQI